MPSMHGTCTARISNVALVLTRSDNRSSVAGVLNPWRSPRNLAKGLAARSWPWLPKPQKAAWRARRGCERSVARRAIKEYRTEFDGCGSLPIGRASSTPPASVRRTVLSVINLHGDISPLDISPLHGPRSECEYSSSNTLPSSILASFVNSGMRTTIQCTQ